MPRTEGEARASFYARTFVKADDTRGHVLLPVRNTEELKPNVQQRGIGIQRLY